MFYLLISLTCFLFFLSLFQPLQFYDTRVIYLLDIYVFCKIYHTLLNIWINHNAHLVLHNSNHLHLCVQWPIGIYSSELLLWTNVAFCTWKCILYYEFILALPLDLQIFVSFNTPNGSIWYFERWVFRTFLVYTEKRSYKARNLFILKTVLQNSRFVPFGANLIRSEPYSGIPDMCIMCLNQRW